MSQVSYTKESNGDVAPLPKPNPVHDSSCIYSGSASAYHDWEFRTRVRVLQHKEKQKLEVLKDLRSAAIARSQSPRIWAGKGYRGFQSFRFRSEQNAGDSGHPTEGESRRARATAAADAGSPSSLSGQREGDDFYDDFRVANACDCCE